MSLRYIIEGILKDAPHADRELVARTVAAFDAVAYDDQYGVRRISVNESLEDAARALFVTKPAAPAPVPNDLVCGMSREDFAALPPARRVELKLGYDAPPAPKRGAKSAPVSRQEILQKTGMTDADFSALSLERRLEIENEVRFTRGQS